MRKPKVSEHQIVSIPKEADAGMPVNGVCQKHGISPATYYKWKPKYGRRVRSVSSKRNTVRAGFYNRSGVEIEGRPR